MYTLLYQGNGYVLSRSDTTETAVPYPPCAREDGNKNHGWVDLRDHPELASRIPEVATLPGMAEILRVIAAPGSPVMTGGCECAAFPQPDAVPAEAWHAGAYVTVMYQDSDLNAKPADVLRIATEILRLTAGPTDGQHVIKFEMILSPLKEFFGRADCYCIIAKPLGYGANEPAAWKALDRACAVMARGVGRLIDRSTGGAPGQRA